MFDQEIRFSAKPAIDFLIKLAIGVASALLISPLIWEINVDTDVMFGSLIACMIPALFGWKVGGVAMLIYVICGTAGLPVFAGHNGGLHYFVPDAQHGYSTSTGFLVGYIMAALVVGYLAERTNANKPLAVFGLFFAGHVLILGMGFVHMFQIPNNSFELLPMLKSFGPSFLIKAGIFVVLLQMIAKKYVPQKI